jgi:hypothetical protein
MAGLPLHNANLLGMVDGPPIRLSALHARARVATLADAMSAIQGGTEQRDFANRQSPGPRIHGSEDRHEIEVAPAV